MKSCWPEAENMPQCGQLSKDCPIKRRCLPGTDNDPFSSYPSKEIKRDCKVLPS